MNTRKRLGLNAEICCAPVFRGLRDRVEFECITDVVAQNAIKMREHDLEAAFLSPVDYARESSDYHIIPNVAVSSRMPSNTIVLHFKEGLKSINTLAVHPTSTSEIVLASILLGEQFDVRPTIVPAMGSLDQMLRSADAALLVGNAALKHAHVSENRIDLVEEWHDMTDLPYVHGFWCVREAGMTKPDILAIQEACDTGVSVIKDIAQAEAANIAPLFSSDSLKQYLEHFSYLFSDEEQDAVMEFLRYAFYHGILPDVADLHFYPVDDEDGTPLPDPSLN